MRGGVVLLLCAMALLMLSMFAGLARADGATTMTVTFKNVTQPMPDNNPCSGAAGVSTITFNGVFHITQDASGGLQATFTMTGDLVFVPVDPKEPTLTGHFTTRGGASVNVNNGVMEFTFTATAMARGTDGSVVVHHDLGHATSIGGEVIVSFFRMRLTCG